MDKVLYIAGYGRSGSTVLDIMLGNHPEMVSVGEVRHLVDDWNNPDRRCACGQRYPECAFWKEFGSGSEFSEELRRTVQEVERRSWRAFIAPGKFFSGERIPEEAKERYRAYHQHLFAYIRQRSGKPIVVDSSKSAREVAGRFHALSEIAGQDVYVLHLVRNGAATAASFQKRGGNWAREGHRGERPFPVMRAVIGWTLANAWVSFLGRRRLKPEHYLRLHFEELVSDPVRSVARIGEFIGVSMAPLVRRLERDEAFNVGHNVGGNRVRKKEAVKLKRERAIGRSGKDELRWYHRMSFNTLGRWLHRYYNISS